MRLVYMGSPLEAVSPLEYLFRDEFRDSYEIVAVVSQAAKMAGRGKKKALLDPPVAEYAKKQNIKTLQPAKARDEDFLKELEELRPDIIITCAYGQILTDKFLKIPTRATINIHPSRLPHFRGATPIQAALLSGCEKTAISILFTVKALDAGNIIIQKDRDIALDECGGELTARLFKESGPLLVSALEKLKDSSFVGTVQDEDQVTLCKKISKEMGLIDWKQNCKEIYNRFRAFNPWPGSYFFLGEKRVLVEEMSLGEEQSLSSLEHGCFTFLKEENKITVSTSTGTLNMKRFKPAGSKSIDAQSFWNGHLRAYLEEQK